MKRKPPSPRSVSAMDETIGKKIREVRISRDVGQVALAESIGVTFQQVQKYESGKNRIAASRLYLVADALDTPVQEFFGE